MSCFSCFSSKVADNEDSSMPAPYKQPNSPKRTTQEVAATNANVPSNNMGAQIFSFRELATATKNFRQECLIGEGGFGRVYKGKLEDTGQVVAVDILKRVSILVFWWFYTISYGSSFDLFSFSSS